MVTTVTPSAMNQLKRWRESLKSSPRRRPSQVGPAVGTAPWATDDAGWGGTSVVINLRRGDPWLQPWGGSAALLSAWQLTRYAVKCEHETETRLSLSVLSNARTSRRACADVRECAFRLQLGAAPAYRRLLSAPGAYRLRRDLGGAHCAQTRASDDLAE